MDAFAFIKNVPVDWSERKILNSEFREYVSIARKDKNSENWYVGGITNENERELKIDFSFLDSRKEYTMKMYLDTKNTHWKENPMEYQITERAVSSNDNIDVYLAPGGGFALEIIAK